MKKLVFVFALLCGVVSLSKAQGPGGGGRMGGTPEERAKRQIDQMQSLNLSDDQKAKITTVILAQAKSQDSIRTAAGANADMQALRPKFMELRAESAKKIAALLTDDQKKAYEKMQADMRSRQGGGGQGGQRPPRDNNNNNNNN